MVRPLQDEEREEIENLIAECELHPERLRTLIVELIRMRSFVEAARRHRGDLRPPAVRKAFEAHLPPKSAEHEYVLMLCDGTQATLELDP